MQTSLFENIQPIEVRQPALRQADVMRSSFVETHKWQEFHQNGQLWIDGEIAVVSEEKKTFMIIELDFQDMKASQYAELVYGQNILTTVNLLGELIMEMEVMKLFFRAKEKVIHSHHIAKMELRYFGIKLPHNSRIVARFNGVLYFVITLSQFPSLL